MKGYGLNNFSYCQNEIFIGNYLCPVVSNASNYTVCQIGYNSGLIPGMKYQIKYDIKNLGTFY